MKTAKKEVRGGLSFRGYTSERAFLDGIVGDEEYRLVTGGVRQMCKHRCEVVFLADDVPDAPPVGSVVSKKGSKDEYLVLTTPYKSGSAGWRLVARNTRLNVAITCSPKDLGFTGEREFTITLKGTEQDAEHLKKIVREHELGVVVEPVS